MSDNLDLFEKYNKYFKNMMITNELTTLIIALSLANTLIF